MDREEEDARAAFEEERRILLRGVAESLSSVVKQMAKANANLNGLEDASCQVEKVAEMWKAAYRRESSNTEPSSNDSSQELNSSLSLLHDDADTPMQYDV